MEVMEVMEVMGVMGVMVVMVVMEAMRLWIFPAPIFIATSIIAFITTSLPLPFSLYYFPSPCCLFLMDFIRLDSIIRINIILSVISFASFI